MKRRPLVLTLSCLALATLACKGGPKQDPILALSADESMAEGKEMMEEEKYGRARPYFVHAFEVEPNSVTGREALLLAAETYYLEGGRTNLVQAEAKYRDFLNRFPTSDRAAYAQFRVAASLAKRMERPDRDQTTARDALAAYEDLLRLYPTTEYAAQARDEMRLVRDNLAEHEYQVGRFYLRYGIPAAAVDRLELLLETYPDYGEKDKALFFLGQAYAAAKRPEDAEGAFGRLRRQYPDSPYLKDVPARAARKEQAAATEEGGR
jgi:outer membrane protein assembly factor BamD